MHTIKGTFRQSTANISECGSALTVTNIIGLVVLANSNQKKIALDCELVRQMDMDKSPGKNLKASCHL